MEFRRKQGVNRIKRRLKLEYRMSEIEGKIKIRCKIEEG